jgi:hypothetical protein
MRSFPAATLRSLGKIGIADASAASASFTGDTWVEFSPRWDPGNLQATVCSSRRRRKGEKEPRNPRGGLNKNQGLAPAALRRWPRRWRRRCLLLARSQHPAHNWCVQLVLALADIAGIVFHSQDEDRQHTFLIEILAGHRHRQNAVQAVLAVGGFVAVLSDVPGEDADLIVIVSAGRRAVR